MLLQGHDQGHQLLEGDGGKANRGGIRDELKDRRAKRDGCVITPGRDGPNTSCTLRLKLG